MDKPSEEEIFLQAGKILNYTQLFMEFEMDILNVSLAMRSLGLNIYKGIPKETDKIEYCQKYWNLCSRFAELKLSMKKIEAKMSKEAIDLSYERKFAAFAEDIKSMYEVYSATKEKSN